MVVKSDRRRQEWNADKLRRSLQVACTKRPISAETIERCVEVMPPHDEYLRKFCPAEPVA